MYSAQQVKTRIKTQCKIRGVQVNAMLTDLGLNPCTVQQIGDSKGIASVSLAKIADYLDCSMDFLMGRTNAPQINISTGDIVGSNIASDGSTATVNSGFSDDDMEILGMLKGLSAVQKAKIILQINEMKNGGIS